MNKKKLMLEEYKLVTRDFNHESDLLWQKTYFFIIVSGALFSYSTSKFASNSIILLVTLAVLGLFVSIIWLCIAYRAIFYITVKEERALTLERHLGFKIYHIAKEYDASDKTQMGKLIRTRPLTAVILPSIFIILWTIILFYFIL